MIAFILKLKYFIDVTNCLRRYISICIQFDKKNIGSFPKNHIFTTLQSIILMQNKCKGTYEQLEKYNNIYARDLSYERTTQSSLDRIHS